MAIATFGTKVFQVSTSKMYTFNDFQYSSSLQTEKQEVLGRKPSTYNKGPDLDSMSFKIHIDAAFGVNPRVEMESWRAIMNAGVAYPFILGGKPLGSSKWLLVSVDESNVNIDNAGKILGVDIDLKFDEYVSAGKPPSNGYAISN
jgi:phage protein U